jgi:hypothetical protein
MTGARGWERARNAGVSGADTGRVITDAWPGERATAGATR